MTHPVRNKFGLLASRGARQAFDELLEALEVAVTGAIEKPGSFKAIPQQHGRRAIPRLQSELHSAMRRDLGVDDT